MYPRAKFHTNVPSNSEDEACGRTDRLPNDGFILSTSCQERSEVNVKGLNSLYVDATSQIFLRICVIKYGTPSSWSPTDAGMLSLALRAQ